MHGERTDEAYKRFLYFGNDFILIFVYAFISLVCGVFWGVFFVFFVFWDLNHM